jgi:transposase
MIPHPEARPVKPYSTDLRERALADCDAGLKTSQVAAKYRVSPAWVRRLKQTRRESGRVAPADYRPGPQPSWAGYAERLAEAVRRQPDATPEDLKAQLALPVALSTLWRACAALGLSVKKKSNARPSRTAPT